MNITKIILWNQENSWNYYRDEISYIDVDDSVSDGKSLECKTKIVGETPEGQSQPRNSRDKNQPAQPLIPTLNKEFTIEDLLIYLWSNMK